MTAFTNGACALTPATSASRCSNAIAASAKAAGSTRWSAQGILKRSRGATRQRLLSYWDLAAYTGRSLWEADHIVPVVEGGGECDLSNLRTLCLRCHRMATLGLHLRRAEARDVARAASHDWTGAGLPPPPRRPYPDPAFLLTGRNTCAQRSSPGNFRPTSTAAPASMSTT